MLPVWVAATDSAAGTVIDYLKIDQFHFSPNGDGSSDSLTVDYQLLTTASIHLLILEKDSVTVVDTLAAVIDQVAGIEHSLNWDGRDGGGTLVAEDTFLVFLRATTATESDSLYERSFDATEAAINTGPRVLE